MKIAYYIAFGNHGPRAVTPPGEGMQVFIRVVGALVVSFVIFATVRMFAGPAPSTMNKEWQEATNEYLRVWALISPHFVSGNSQNKGEPEIYRLERRNQNANNTTGTKLRAHLRYLVRRLQRTRPSPIPT